MALPDPNRDNPNANWLVPLDEQEGLRRYVATIRERLWLIVAITALTTLAAIAYVQTATKTYEAQANLQVQGTIDPDLQSLGLIAQSSDPTREIQTASEFVTTVAVADRVKKSSAIPDPPSDLLAAVKAEPGRTEPARRRDGFRVRLPSRPPTSPTRSRRRRSMTARSRCTRRSPPACRISSRWRRPRRRTRPRARSPSTPPSSAARSDIARQRQGRPPGGRELAEAQAEHRRRDHRRPRARHRRRLRLPGARPAAAPRGAAAPPLPDPDHRPDPAGAEALRGRPLGPRDISPAIAEAYRTLRGTARRDQPASGGRLRRCSSPARPRRRARRRPRSTSPPRSPPPASSVILIEADLRRPAISRALGVEPRRGVVGVLIESVTLEDALIDAEQLRPPEPEPAARRERGRLDQRAVLPADRARDARARQGSSPTT